MRCLIGHAHGVDEPAADAATVAFVWCAAGVMVRWEEQPFVEIAHSARHFAVIDRRGDDERICGEDLLEHRRQRIALGAFRVAWAAESLAGKAADAAAEIDIKEVDAFCFGAGCARTFEGIVEKLGRMPGFARTAVDTNHFHNDPSSRVDFLHYNTLPIQSPVTSRRAKSRTLSAAKSTV